MAAGLLKKLNPSMMIDIVEYGVNQDFHEAQWNPGDRPVVLFVEESTKEKAFAIFCKWQQIQRADTLNSDWPGWPIEE